MPGILLWFPHAFHFPRMGSQQGAMKLLKGLLATGQEVRIASADYPPGSGMEWNEEGFRVMREMGVASVDVHRSALDDILGFVLRKMDSRTGRVRPIRSRAHCPPFLRGWFGRVSRRVNPDLLVASYAVSDPLVERSGLDRARCILDLPDLVSANKAMRRFLSKHLPPAPLHPSQASAELLDLECYAPLLRSGFAEELGICARYGRVLAVSRREADLVEARGGKAEHLPVCMPPVPLDNSRDGAALLAAGPNAFNAQGYLWFAAGVLPRLRQQVPDFRLELTGALCKDVAPLEGIHPLGFVDDLRDVYSHARFSICPVFGGTGQQVKVVESMAHGVPVVALAGPARESPIRHGENGLVCANEEEFALSCAALWNDSRLRNRLGEAARATVASEASGSLYEERLVRIVREVQGRTGRNAP